MSTDVDRTFEEDVKINKYELELCAEEQPSFMHYWSDQEADAKKEKSEAIKFVKELRAEKTLYYFTNPKSGIKPTVDNVKAMIESDDEVKKAEQNVIDLTHKADKASNKVTALEHRKSELNNLTQLWVKRYYSESEGKRTVTDEKADDARKQLNKKEEDD
jgi:hypothetical protein